MVSTLADYYPSVSLEHNTQNSTNRGSKEKSEKNEVFFQNNCSKIPLQLRYKYEQFEGGEDPKKKNYKACANRPFK